MDCPICKLSEKYVTTRSTEDRDLIDCPRCGKYAITGTAAVVAAHSAADFRLSAWLRGQVEAGSATPVVSTATLSDVPKTLPKYKMSEKQLLLLRAIERKTEIAGKSVTITPEFDFTLAWCSTEGELEFLMQALLERGLLKVADVVRGLEESFVHDVTITASGWEYLEDRERPSVLPNQVFVAMSFADELRSAWENGIYPALKRARFNPYRIDAAPHIDRIDTKIVAEIKNSRFLVADVTQQRPGVYFEAGYANGLGIPVFWSVRADDLKNVHFDTRQYNHIVWDTEATLADKLYDFVSAIIGTGTAA